MKDVPAHPVKTTYVERKVIPNYVEKTIQVSHWGTCGWNLIFLNLLFIKNFKNLKSKKNKLKNQGNANLQRIILFRRITAFEGEHSSKKALILAPRNSLLKSWKCEMEQ